MDIQDITITTNNGNIAFGSATINHLQINTLDGNISFDNTLYKQVSNRAKNGNVIGTFSGNMADYSIVTETVGGNSNLNSKVGGEIQAISISTPRWGYDISFDK